MRRIPRLVSSSNSSLDTAPRPRARTRAAGAGRTRSRRSVRTEWSVAAVIRSVDAGGAGRADRDLATVARGQSRCCGGRSDLDAGWRHGAPASSCRDSAPPLPIPIAPSFRALHRLCNNSPRDYAVSLPLRQADVACGGAARGIRGNDNDTRAGRRSQQACEVRFAPLTPGSNGGNASAAAAAPKRNVVAQPVAHAACQRGLSRGWTSSSRSRCRGRLWVAPRTAGARRRTLEPASTAGCVDPAAAEKLFEGPRDRGGLTPERLGSWRGTAAARATRTTPTTQRRRRRSSTRSPGSGAQGAGAANAQRGCGRDELCAQAGSNGCRSRLRCVPFTPCSTARTSSASIEPRNARTTGERRTDLLSAIHTNSLNDTAADGHACSKTLNTHSLWRTKASRIPEPHDQRSR